MRMSLKASTLVLALLLPFTQAIHAQVPKEAGQRQDWAAFIKPFPAVDSDEGKADLAIVLWHQRIRTQAEVQRALAEVKLGLGAYAAAVGHPLEASQYPNTAALIDKVGRDVKVVTDGLKQHFLRPRPYQADPRVQPAIEREPSPSYPSGHATRGLAFAMVLADLAPERREALLAQGRLVGVDRVIGGVHYPSDIEAGQRLALRFADAWLADPRNRSLVEAVRAAEWTVKPKP
jgi:acid phosphatase (class A)